MARFRLLGVPAASLLLLGSLPHGAGAGSPDRTVAAGAQATGAFVRYGIPGFTAIDNFVDSGGPIAQAVLDSTGTSTAFASFPYPGSAVMALPGLAAFASGTAPPGYPLYAHSSHPTTPEETVGDPDGPYSLTASAADGESASEARAAASATPSTPGLTSSQASSKVVNASGGTGQVSSEAVSVARGITIGDLSVGIVRSSSRTTFEPGATVPTSQTELVLEGGKAGPLSFTFDREGLRVSDQGLSLPAEEGLAGLNNALAPGGLAVRFHEPSAIPGGAVASAFEVTNTADVPGAGKGTLQVRVGGATSWVILGEMPPVTLPGDAVPTIPIDSAPVGPSTGAPPSAPAMPTPIQTLAPSISFGVRGAAGGGADPVAESLSGGASPSQVTDSDVPAVQAAAEPAFAYGQPLFSPREFNAPSVLAVMTLSGGFMTAGWLVIWQMRRRLA